MREPLRRERLARRDGLRVFRRNSRAPGRGGEVRDRRWRRRWRKSKASARCSPAGTDCRPAHLSALAKRSCTWRRSWVFLLGPRAALGWAAATCYLEALFFPPRAIPGRGPGRAMGIDRADGCVSASHRGLTPCGTMTAGSVRDLWDDPRHGTGFPVAASDRAVPVAARPTWRRRERGHAGYTNGCAVRNRRCRRCGSSTSPRRSTAPTPAPC